jgi:hypothetical protein
MWIEMRRLACVGVLGVFLFATSGCSALYHSEPDALKPSALRWRMAVTILTMAGGPINTARLTVTDGPDKGVQASSDPSGRYAFASLQGGTFHVIIEAPGFASVTPVVDLSRDLSVDFALSRTP